MGNGTDKDQTHEEIRPSGWEAVLYLYHLCPSIVRKKEKNDPFV